MNTGRIRMRRRRPRGCWSPRRSSPAAPTSPRRWSRRPRSISPRTIATRRSSSSRTRCRRIPTWPRRASSWARRCSRRAICAAAEKELRKAARAQVSGRPGRPAARARAAWRAASTRKRIDEFGEGRGRRRRRPRPSCRRRSARRSMATRRRRGARAAAFAAALAAQPGYPPALLGEARLKAAAGDLPGALALVETALAKSPTLTEGWQLKGDIAGRAGAGRRCARRLSQGARDEARPRAGALRA